MKKCHQQLLSECTVGWNVLSLAPLLHSLRRSPLLMCNHNCRSASALIPFLPFCLLLGQTGGINPTGPGSILHSLCPRKSRGEPSLEHPQQSLKELLQNCQEKSDMGIPGSFCHKGGIRVVQTHAAERNIGK